MRYFISKAILGEIPEIEISAQTYTELNSARMILVNAFAIEEKYEIVVSNYLDFENSLNCDALPPVGGSTNQLITSTCVLRLASGGPPGLYSGGAVMTVHLFGDPGVNPREFGLELLALDFPFFSLPAATKLRESPTLPSSGHATITEGPPGQFHIESFFDVFFELSTDSGQSWFPASGPLRAVLSPAAPLPARPATWGCLLYTSPSPRDS